MTTTVPNVQKQAVLLMSHFFNKNIEDKYKRLTKELNIEQYDVFLLLNINNKEDISAIPSYINLCAYNADDLNSLGYIPAFETLLPGSCHFPVMIFYQEHPMYKFYWFIEYDVHFTAPWSVLLDGYIIDVADYIVPYLAKYDNNSNGDWVWWKKQNKSGFDLDESYKSFHPICRYSEAALKSIHEYQMLGFSAHSEVLIPTCLSHVGLSLKTFDEKYFIREQHFNSFRYRPVIKNEEFEKNKLYCKLYHPIKV